MAPDQDHKPPRNRRQGDTDDDELDALRALAVKVFIGLSVLVVVMDSTGRLFRDPAFKVDPVVMGLVFGTLLALLGLEAANRLMGGKS